jgi:U3 small nucleolar RNA-associated protein 13
MEEQMEEQMEKQMEPSAPAEHQPAALVPTLLSRSWSVRSAHVPIFTGGRVTHSRTTSDPNNSDPAKNTTTTTTNYVAPFLLLPVGGNVTLVDATKGTRLATVRGIHDDHDEGMDDDDIVAYTLSWNNQIIVTCSRNSLLQLYSVCPTTTTTGSSTAGATGTRSDASPSTTTTTTAEPAGVVHTATTRPMIQWIRTLGKSGHVLPVTVLQFHRSNVFLATGSVDGSVRIWDTRGSAGFVTHVFRPHAAGSSSSGGGGSGTLAVTAVQWMPQELVVAVARDDGSIAIHNLRQTLSSSSSSLAMVVLRDHVSAVTCMEWNEDASLFVSTGRDAVVNLWRVLSTGQGKKRYKKENKETNDVPTTVIVDHQVVVRYERLHTLPIYEQVEGLVLLPPVAGRTELVVATAGTKGRVRLWTVNPSDASPRLKRLYEQPDTQAFGEARGGYISLGYAATTHESSVQEQLIVADAEHNISFLSIHVDKKDALVSNRTIVGHNDDILDLKVIPFITGEAKRIVVATNSAQVRLFELENFSCDVLDRHTATVLCVDVSPCGRYIATCGKDKQMLLWHLGRQTCVAVAAGHTEAIGSTALSRKLGRYDVQGKAATNGGGAFVVTVSMDRTLKRWNLPGAASLNRLADNGQEVALSAFISTRAHDKDINIVSVAPNDSYIATGSQDKTVKLWKSSDLSLVATLKGHRRGVWDCQFSPFDRVVATGSGDKTLKLWSLSDFSCVRTFQGHAASVLRVRFLSGGLQLVSSGADGLVKLWTIRTNECETTMDFHNDKVWALDLAGNGKSLVSGGADSQLVVWEDTTKEVEEAKHAEAEEAILLDQKLANHLRHKEYDQALEISLARDKPHQTLKVLTTIVETDQQRGLSGLGSLQGYAKKWSVENLVRVLHYCREWNTRARNSTVALLTFKAIVTSIPADTLASTDGVPEILAGIVPYAERHFDRLDRLFASSYLLDYVLFSMGSIDDDKSGEEFLNWQSASRLVLPPKEMDGRAQVAGRYQRVATAMSDSDDVLTIGESDSDDDDEVVVSRQ